MAAPAGLRIVLLGPMGTGKSTLGKALAQRLGGPFVDNDEALEEFNGRSARDILSADGLAALRAAEAATAFHLLALPPPVVVALAAGVIEDGDVRRSLRQVDTVVLLTAAVQTLAERVRRDEEQGKGRPWVGTDPAAALRRLSQGREPLYAEVADIVVDVDQLSPEQAVAQVLAEIGCPS